MSGVNKVILVGRLGKNPEYRTLENGTAVATFPLATSETWKDRDSGERKEQTEWHNVVLWRGLADVAENYLNKGNMVYIEGKLRTRSWEKDGITRYITEVHGDNMTMLSTKSNSAPPPEMTEKDKNAISTPAGDIALEDEEDDLPF